MKQSENNEIDTLLRNLARRRRSADPADYESESASREFAAKGAHLDVDELSSYAERALPPSARARCTAHLADCDDCRKIVAQLSLAAGPLTDERPIEPDAVVGLTWTEWLAALFSPRMLRYAMPALAIAIVAIVFFGWRQQLTERANDQVAINERVQPGTVTKATPEQSAADDKTATVRGKTGGLAAERDEREAKEQPAATPAPPVAGAKAEAESSDEKKAGGEASGSTVASKAAKQDAPPADKAGERPGAYAAEPAPAAKPQSASVTQEQQKDLAKNNVNNNVSNDSVDRGRDANAQSQGPARNNTEVANQRGPAKSQSQQAPKMKVADAGSAARARSDEEEEETRAVAGRRFHRVNNSWVDTAYKSSMSVRNVTRGTEEYSALVADEPAIGTIGKQLSGEVIVVWKGRAYRIN